MGKLEAEYRLGLADRLRTRFPGCVVIKNDPSENQGIPDLLILFGSNWAMLETKRSRRANIQPNQGYYVEFFNDLSFAAFVYPENEEEILDALQSAFGVSW